MQPQCRRDVLLMNLQVHSPGQSQADGLMVSVEGGGAGGGSDCQETRGSRKPRPVDG